MIFCFVYNPEDMLSRLKKRQDRLHGKDRFGHKKNVLKKPQKQFRVWPLLQRYEIDSK